VTDKLSPERRSANMRNIRSKHTSPEMAVRRLVHGMGFRYRLHVPTLPGRPDMVFSRLGRIIDVRGCFWHQHRGCIDSRIPKTRIKYWKPKLTGNVKRDARNAQKLRRLGWEVLTLWECEVSAVTIPQRIRSFLNS
jgi:DNA mismatch endonuclease, patch repair protein